MAEKVTRKRQGKELYEFNLSKRVLDVRENSLKGLKAIRAFSGLLAQDLKRTEEAAGVKPSAPRSSGPPEAQFLTHNINKLTKLNKSWRVQDAPEIFQQYGIRRIIVDPDNTMIETLTTALAAKGFIQRLTSLLRG